MEKPQAVRRLASLSLVCVIASAVVLGQPASRTYPMARSGGNYMHNYYFPPAPGSTPWAPAWAPDGKSIAVAMGGSIWRVDPATGSAEELTADDKYHSLPAWSPDGRYLAYTADDGGTNIHLYVLEVATGKTWPLGNDKFVYTDPTFSPDGTRLAYVSTRPNGYFNVYVRPISDGQWAGDEIAVTQRPLVRARPPVLRRVGRQHHAGVDEGRPRAADRLQPRRPARLRQRAARAGRRERHRQGADRAGRADALSHAARRVDRRQAVHLRVDARQRRSVQQPVRAADQGRRALQADVLRSTTPFIRAGRRTASGLPTSPTARRTACRSWRCSKPTAASSAR